MTDTTIETEDKKPMEGTIKAVMEAVKKRAEEQKIIAGELKTVKDGIIKDQTILSHYDDSLGIPLKFSKKTLATFKTTDKELLSKLGSAMEHNISVFLTGECGSGKTHLAVAMLYYWIAFNMELIKDEDGIRPSWKAMGGIPRFVSAPELYLELRKTFVPDSQLTQDDILNKYSKTSLLVIDEIGTEVTDYTKTSLYLLINRRCNAMLPTIITSNFDRQAIAENIDDRLASRISEMGIVVKLKGDYRLTINQENEKKVGAKK